jgi:hypothetical protein
MNKKVVNCHKCGWHGYFGIKSESKPQKEYKLPETKNLTELSQDNLNFFLERGITQNTVIRNQIKNGLSGWFAFTYYEGEVIVNMKYRKGREKKFMQAGEAKPTMYKYNDINGQNEIIICEGEFDALSWEEAGFKNAIIAKQLPDSVAAKRKRVRGKYFWSYGLWQSACNDKLFFRHKKYFILLPCSPAKNYHYLQNLYT